MHAIIVEKFQNFALQKHLFSDFHKPCLRESDNSNATNAHEFDEFVPFQSDIQAKKNSHFPFEIPAKYDSV